MKEGWAEAVSGKPRSGRKRAISEEQLEEIKSFFKVKHGASLREVQAHFADTMGWNLPLSTLDRTLHMYTQHCGRSSRRSRQTSLPRSATAASPSP